MPHQTARSFKKVQCWIFSSAGKGSPAHCLLLKTNAARGGFWQPVTGTVEDGEGYLEAACREAAEETGFAFPKMPLDSGHEFSFISRFGQARERTFALYIDGLPIPLLDPREHDDFRWVLPSNAAELLRYPSNREGLAHSYQSLFGKEPLSK